MANNRTVGDDAISAFSALNVAVTTTAGAIAAQAKQFAERGIRLRANPANSDIIYVRESATAVDTEGWPLDAGEELFLPISDPTRIYVKAASGTQALHVLVL